MSSLTSQESSRTQPENPINPGTPKSDSSVPFKVGDTSSTGGGLSSGTVDKSSYGQQNASGTSEQRRSEDITRQEAPGSGDVGTKTGSESLIESVEKSVHEQGQAVHSDADKGQVGTGR